MNNVSEIAKLNDEFRANPSLGTLILTEGIRSNSSEDITTIINKVRNFKDFNENNNLTPIKWRYSCGKAYPYVSKE